MDLKGHLMFKSVKDNTFEFQTGQYLVRVVTQDCIIPNDHIWHEHLTLSNSLQEALNKRQAKVFDPVIEIIHQPTQAILCRMPYTHGTQVSLHYDDFIDSKSEHFREFVQSAVVHARRKQTVYPQLEDLYTVKTDKPCNIVHFDPRK
jgi:hypothetical protein